MADDCKEMVFSEQGSSPCELTVTMTTCTSSELAQAGPNPSMERGRGNQSLFLEEELLAMDSCWLEGHTPKDVRAAQIGLGLKKKRGHKVAWLKRRHRWVLKELGEG